MTVVRREVAAVHQVKVAIATAACHQIQSGRPSSMSLCRRRRPHRRSRRMKLRGRQQHRGRLAANIKVTGRRGTRSTQRWIRRRSVRLNRRRRWNGCWARSLATDTSTWTTLLAPSATQTQASARSRQRMQLP